MIRQWIFSLLVLIWGTSLHGAHVAWQQVFGVQADKKAQEIEAESDPDAICTNLILIHESYKTTRGNLSAFSIAAARRAIYRLLAIPARPRYEFAQSTAADFLFNLARARLPHLNPREFPEEFTNNIPYLSARNQGVIALALIELSNTISLEEQGYISSLITKFNLQEKIYLVDDDKYESKKLKIFAEIWSDPSFGFTGRTAMLLSLTRVLESSSPSLALKAARFLASNFVSIHPGKLKPSDISPPQGSFFINNCFYQASDSAAFAGLYVLNYFYLKNPDFSWESEISAPLLLSLLSRNSDAVQWQALLLLHQRILKNKGFAHEIVALINPKSLLAIAKQSQPFLVQVIALAADLIPYDDDKKLNSLFSGEDDQESPEANEIRLDKVQLAKIPQKLRKGLFALVEHASTKKLTGFHFFIVDILNTCQLWEEDIKKYPMIWEAIQESYRPAGKEKPTSVDLQPL